MKYIYKLVLMLALLPSVAMAQGKYQINGVAVIQHGDTLRRNAWVGGFNNPVFSSIDLNQDGLMDLFIYDKAGWKATSFINTGSVGHPSFTYDPTFDAMYPTDLRDWAVIRDYNHDGVGDIFALTINSDMEVYKGYRNGNILSYQLIYKHLMYTYSTFKDHIWTFMDNMPVIMDIDNDGAIDVLAPDIANGATLDYYHNVAVDSGYSADSLVFTDASACWGGFIEDGADCNVTLAQCKKELTIDTATDRDLRHQGGACWGTKYDRRTNVVSVFIADIYCNTMKFLENTGDTSFADVTYVDTLFPSYDVPIDIPLMPAIYGIDADNDGFQDLMVAPFASNANVTSQSEDINVIHYYHNNAGTDTVNTYHYEGDTLLNNSIVDVGTESHPVFFDYNGDSLMDIVIGRFGQFVAPGNPQTSTSGTAISSLYLYKNVGTDTMPVFQLVDTDWNHLSAYDAAGLFNGIYPAFGDLDGDGLPDMVVGDFSGNISFFHNAGTANNALYPAMSNPIINSSWYGINVGFDAAPFIYDMNGDGLNDLVIGSSGRTPTQLGSHIFYYWNFGTVDSPKFSPDSVNNFFGNVVVWDSSLGIVEGFANPVIVKERDSLMLYSGSQRGLTFKYFVDTNNLRSGPFPQLSANLLGISPGLRSNVSVADINHDGKNDYLTGNIRGGIMLFSDTAWNTNFYYTSVSNVPISNDQFDVFPNPAKEKVMCTLGKGAQTLVSAQLYDLLGKAVATNVSQMAPGGLTLTVADLSEGIYIVQARDINGKTYQQKISIIK